MLSVSNDIDVSQREIRGEVKRVHQLAPGFFAIEIKSDRTIYKLTGEMDPAEADRLLGMGACFYGQWKEHPRYGWQFVFSGVSVLPGATPTGVVNYLSRSGLGITAREASRMVARYGTTAVDVLRKNAAKVVSDGYLDQAKADHAAEVLRDLERYEMPRMDLFQLFSGHGLTRKTVDACIKEWGLRAPEIVRKDPFRMLVSRLEDVGFAKADGLYQAMGLPLHRLKRQTLAGWHAMATDGDGNTWMHEGVFAKAVMGAVGFELLRGEKALALGLRSKWLRQRDGWLSCAERAAAEETVAGHLVRLMKGRAIWPAMAQGDLSDHQFASVQPLLTSAVGILAGTPGTGKTYTAAALLRAILPTVPASRIAVCAPTGKAAVRIGMAMERYGLPLQATTIHRLLMGGPEGGFRFNESTPLPHEVVLVDETSMVDVELMAALLSALRDGCNVLLVGDPYQLPPVGHGAPLRDFLASNVPNALLTEIKRNAGLIVEACREIKEGRNFKTTDATFNADPGCNLKAVHVEDPKVQVGLLLKVLAGVVSKGLDPIWDTQVIVARNKDTEVSRSVLNPILQNLLNPKNANVPLGASNEKYRVGDKFICLRNQAMKAVEIRKGGEDWNVNAYVQKENPAYVANGDQGRVLAVSADKVVVRFMFPDRVVLIDEKPATSKDFDLAYAITCHKSQGSEWPFVIVMVDQNGWGVCCREWVYTAISRAAKMCLVLGDSGALSKFIGKVQLWKRKTFLKEVILEARK